MTDCDGKDETDNEGRRSNLRQTSERWGELGRSVLNGIIGDYLHKENNPLAIQMGLYRKKRKLVLDADQFNQFDFSTTNKVVILVHGLTNLETIWDYPSPTGVTNYGEKLQQDFSYTPLFLRYNTGLSIEQNAQELSNILNKLLAVYPIKIDDLSLIGFSMGGLLVRQAQCFATDTNADWLNSLSKCIYIGSPHEGAPLEKFGHLAGEVFRQLPKEYLSHWADVIDARSEGIKNLKHGLKNTKPVSAEGVCESFVSSARHYFISGGMFEPSFSVLNKIIGDSLVRQSSAVPSSAPNDSLSAHFDGLAHVPLAHSELVYQQIKKWFEGDEAERKLDLVSIAQASASLASEEYELAVSEDNISNRDLITGTIDLLANGFDRAVDTVETMHYSISQEPFSKSQELPVVSQFAYPIEKIHKGVSNSVFSSLRFGGKVVHKLAKSAASTVKGQKNDN